MNINEIEMNRNSRQEILERERRRDTEIEMNHLGGEKKQRQD